MLFAALPAREAQAFVERTHGIATILAFEYLQHRAATGDVEASDTVDYYQDLFDDIEVGALNDPFDKVVLGYNPEDTVGFGGAPKREEPGLSGPNDTSSNREFPASRATLLGAAVASVDERTDVWATATHPYQIILDRVDEKSGPFGNALVEAWWDWLTQNFSECAEVDGWFNQFLCYLAAFLVFLVVLIVSAPIIMVGSWVTNADSDNIHEGMTEDALSGCDDNEFGGQIIDAIAESEDLTPEEVSQLRNDEAFYQALGINFGSCDEMEEGLEDIKEIKLYGAPKNIAQALFSSRARLADMILACDKDGVDGSDDDMETDVEDCNDHSNLINAHFRAVEPWMLSHEGMARGAEILLPGAAKFHDRWKMDNSYTSMTHFMDLLSPANGTAIDFTDPNTSISVMKTMHGKIHPFDGYSLGEGKRFQPTPTLIDPFDLSATEIDGDIITAASDFNLDPSSSSGHLILRRRVCFDGANGTTGLAGLKTTDGLGASDCSPTGATPLGFSTAGLPEEIHAPSEMGALDGFTLFAFGELSPELSFNDGSQQLTYTYFDSFLPFLLQLEDHGNSLGAPFLQCADPIKCDGNQARYVSWMHQLLDPHNHTHRKAMRVRGLALSLHMIQDLAVPHHIAPTSGYGHVEYETWVAAWFWPQEQTISVRNADLPGLNGTQSGSIGDEEIVSNRWRVNGVGLSSDDLFQRVLTAADSEGFWSDVDTAFTRLESDMSSLSTPTCPSDRFSTRRLARSIAYETAYSVSRRGGDATGLSTVSTNDKKAGAFWLLSALTAEHPDSGMDSIVGNGVWQSVANDTVPFAVAASALLMINAAKAARDPSTTCDGGEDPGPDPNRGTTVPLSAPTCSAQRVDELLSCFKDPTQSMCAQFANIAQYPACAGNLYSKPGCGRLALAMARCSCSVSVPAGVPASRAIGTCTANGLRASHLDALRKGGAIDEVTYRYLSTPSSTVGTHEQSGVDRDGDGDGIPDSVDRCPLLGGAAGMNYQGTGLSAGVAWLDAPNGRTTAYGCPIASSSSRGGE